MTKNANGDLVTLMRDPAAPSGAIDLVNIEAAKPKKNTGSEQIDAPIQASQG